MVNLWLDSVELQLSSSLGSVELQLKLVELQLDSWEIPRGFHGLRLISSLALACLWLSSVVIWLCSVELQLSSG